MGPGVVVVGDQAFDLAQLDLGHVGIEAQHLIQVGHYQTLRSMTTTLSSSPPLSMPQALRSPFWIRVRFSAVILANLAASKPLACIPSLMARYSIPRRVF